MAELWFVRFSIFHQYFDAFVIFFQGESTDNFNQGMQWNTGGEDALNGVVETNEADEPEECDLTPVSALNNLNIISTKFCLSFFMFALCFFMFMFFLCLCFVYFFILSYVYVFLMFMFFYVGGNVKANTNRNFIAFHCNDTSVDVHFNLLLNIPSSIEKFYHRLK